jgi:asparagine synthase (glutamine-hydrolysing)
VPSASLPTEVFDEPLPSFLTSNGAKLARDASARLDPAPSASAARSFYEAAAACSPLFLRSGIWPLHPYGAPEVVAFCRNLPAAWRRDRSLQRHLLRSYGLSERVVRPDPPESFLPLRDLAMRGSAREPVHRLMANSALAALGIIDLDRFSSSYDAYCKGGPTVESDSLLQTVLLESALQSLT